jgi:hypothetical protein
MDYAKTLLSLFLLLASAVQATDVNAEFQNNLPAKDYHFNTDMRFITNFGLSVVSGTVVSGNPNNLQSGDTVCTGVVVKVTPTADANWATSSVDIYSMYPSCSPTYCPIPPDAGGATTNNPIKWLAPAAYNSYDSYGDSNNFYLNWGDQIAKTAYNDLGPFYNEPGSFNNGSGVYTNKEGGASVLCKGSVEVKDDATTKGSTQMPTITPVEFAIADNGNHVIATGLSGVSCFGDVVKHPLNQNDYPGFFRIYTFTQHQPSVPEMSGEKTITLNVINTSGTCMMHTTAISVSLSTATTGMSMVRTRVRNDADPIKVNGVASSNLAFSVIPFPVALGPALGFPSSICPVSNGFNETFNNGADKDLYVLVTTSATSGGTVLTYSAETASTVCGNAGKCNAIADLTVNGGVTCDIAPPSLKLKPLEVGAFAVTCHDLAGASVPCIGSNWVSSTNLVGTILNPTNKRAEFYSQAKPPASGTLTYKSDNGVIDIATCNSSLSIVDQNQIINTTYNCSFVPPSAKMVFNEKKYFALSCLANGTIPATPINATYDSINGLSGTTDNGTVKGVTYTAPAIKVAGNLRGIGYFGVRPNVIAAVALASLEVSNGSNDPYACEIQPQESALGTQEIGEFKVTCRNAMNTVVDCIGNAWAWSNISGGFITAETDNKHAWAYPTSPEGSRGLMTYTSGLALCNATVNVTNATFTCRFNPPNVKMDWNKTQYFETHAYKNGTVVTPTRVIYDLIGGLGGNHTNDTVSGTLYGAPGFNNSGQLQGGAELVTGSNFVKGATCLAPIIVGGGNNSNNTNNTIPDGSSQWCTISGNGKLHPGYTGWVSIWCGPKANQACNGVAWSGTGASIISWSNTGAYIKVTAPVGATGRVTAYVGNNQSQTCFLPFTSEETNCVELS